MIANAWVDLMRSDAIYDERGYLMQPNLVFKSVVDGSYRTGLKLEEIMEFKANTARHVIHPTYVGGKSWYGDPMTLARERIMFVTALIRIMQPCSSPDLTRRPMAS